MARAALRVEHRRLRHRGGAPDERFPDNKINKDDREFKFNQLLSVSLGFFFPTKLKNSE